MQAPVEAVQAKWTLPPLILHPFSGPAGPDKILESSRANLMLQGILPRDERSEEELQRKLYDGRYQEVRMLFYVGKDLERWMEQCQDFVNRIPELSDLGVQGLSFLDLLVNRPPHAVVDKLKGWGVVNHTALFSRACGLHALFKDLPPIYLLNDEFLLNYYRYVDAVFQCRLKMNGFYPLEARSFYFDLFASREYSQLLEEQWRGGR